MKNNVENLLAFAGALIVLAAVTFAAGDALARTPDTVDSTTLMPLSNCTVRLGLGIESGSSNSS